MRLQKTVVTDKPLARVFDYLSDFTSTTDWDPGTVATVRQSGDGGIGTSYLNTSQFLGRKTELRYVVDLGYAVDQVYSSPPDPPHNPDPPRWPGVTRGPGEADG